MEEKVVLENIREQIAAADMVLIGLGEEFQCPAKVKAQPEYERGCQCIKQAEKHWLLPAWEDYCEKKADAGVDAALKHFLPLLEGKNYFVVSTAMNERIATAPWKQDRLVMPCGTALKLQCEGECEESPKPLSEEQKNHLKEIMDDLWEGKLEKDRLASLGCCPSCGRPMILNNIYAENYCEKGYLEQWAHYTKWLQGTVNRKVLILELGVGMKFPTVIRFPFEKVAYFNQKAVFVRINEKLYQITEELKDKAAGISQNALEWMKNL